MNGLNLYITVSAVVLGILSAYYNVTGKKAYKDNATFFESSNHELREQNSSLREEKITLSQELATVRAESAEKDKTIENLKPFTEVVQTMSNNHRVVMQALTNVTAIITEKVQNGGES